MNLTLILILFVPLLLIPCFLLPSNKVRMYVIPSLISFIVVVLIMIINVGFPELNVERNIGSVFLPLSHFFYAGYVELSEPEIYHLSYTFFLLFLFAVLFILLFIPIKLFFVGSNPSSRKPMRYITKVFLALSLFISFYTIIALFFINIRIILPFQDGFLSSLFSIIYPIEA